MGNSWTFFSFTLEDSCSDSIEEMVAKIILWSSMEIWHDSQLSVHFTTAHHAWFNSVALILLMPSSVNVSSKNKFT